jgi:DNA-binding NarL/FixJ family response regulator
MSLFRLLKQLHGFFFRMDAERPVETRQFEQEAHFAQPAHYSPFISIQDKKYLTLWKSLTFRQQEVLALACMGHRNFEIARMLNVEDGTIKSHWQLIFRKFNMRDRTEIRNALREWDFHRWWEERYIKPRPLPRTTTGG